VSRRLRRLPAALLPVVLLAGLTACGGGDDSSSASSPLDSVSISGDVGKEPTVDWKSQMTVNSVSSKTLTTGDGAKLEEGDTVNALVWIGDGYTKQQASSGFDRSPEQVPIDSNGNTASIDALKGQTIGSRVAITAPADKIFGSSGNAQLGIGNKDGVLIIIDLVSLAPKPLDGPQGKSQPAPSWAPKVVEKNGAVTSLDFSKAPKPDGKLRDATLIQGTGATVKKGQNITVNYLGQVYGAKAPFDESYSKGSPLQTVIGAGQVIPGWDKTIVGKKVGSRVLLAIPPKEGYGSQGSPQAGIKGTDTIYFVVDILAAS